MYYQQKISGLKLVLLMLVIALSMACNILTRNPDVQDIVPAQQKPISWQLSPAGAKLLFATESQRGQAVMRILATNQEITIPGCLEFRWLDDESIYCYGKTRPSVFTVDMSSDTNTPPKNSR